jgi:hypothetical protein
MSLLRPSGRWQNSKRQSSSNKSGASKAPVLRGRKRRPLAQPAQMWPQTDIQSTNLGPEPSWAALRGRREPSQTETGAMRAGNALGSHGPLRSLEAYEICGLMAASFAISTAEFIE